MYGHIFFPRHSAAATNCRFAGEWIVEKLSHARPDSQCEADTSEYVRMPRDPSPLPEGEKVFRAPISPFPQWVG